MARRTKSRPIEDVLALVSMFPWWVGVSLAAAFYFWLHHVAGQPIAAVAKPGELINVIAPSAGRSVATMLQYVLPLLCLVAAGISALKSRKRNDLLLDVAQSEAAYVLDRMSWQDFELLVGESFRREGFRVIETGQGGADGGIDLVLSRNDEKFFVQCKQWKAFRVGVDVVRELYGVMAARGATGGFVVTSGRYSPDAQRFASGRNIQLIDGPALRDRIRSVRSAKDGGPADLELQRAASEPAAVASVTETPACPVCSQRMVLRKAKKGANAGDAFWGCSAYPACRGTRQV